MRRNDKAIHDEAEIIEIIKKSTVCRLAMCHRKHPYIVPMSFGFKDNTLYFHSAPKGKKVTLLQKNPRVCFEFELFNQVIGSARPCKWGMKYRSIIGYGQAEFIKDPEQKRMALDIIMRQYADEDEAPFAYDDNLVQATLIFKVTIERMTGKKSEI